MQEDYRQAQELCNSGQPERGIPILRQILGYMNGARHRRSDAAAGQGRSGAPARGLGRQIEARSGEVWPQCLKPRA
jgi:hypothetical protein